MNPASTRSRDEPAADAVQGPTHPSHYARPVHCQPDFVASLAKGLQVLAAFEHAPVLGNHELVDVTGLPKATVSRLTGTLAQLGYLHVDEATRKYRTGARVLGMATLLIRQNGVLRVARSHMEALAGELGISVLLTTRQHLAMLLLEIVHPAAPGAPATRKQVGDLLSMDTTSLGLAYLVAAPTAERVKILAALQRAQLVEWHSYRADVERVHQEYKTLGYVVSRRVRGGALNAVAVPIVLDAGVFVLSCAGLAAQFTKARIAERIGPRMRDAVAGIRAAMAHPGPPSPSAPAPTRR